MGPGTLLPPMSTTHLGSPPHHCPWDLLLPPCSSASSPAAGMQIGGGARGRPAPPCPLTPSWGPPRAPTTNLHLYCHLGFQPTLLPPPHPTQGPGTGGTDTPQPRSPGLLTACPSDIAALTSCLPLHCGTWEIFPLFALLSPERKQLVGLSFPSVPAVARHTEIP